MKWTSYESRFPPEECVRRIMSATEPDGFLADWKLREGVLSRVGERMFRLRLRRAYVRNSFSRLLYARLEPTPAGSLIKVRTGLHPSVLVFSIVWFGGAVVIGGLMMLTSVLQVLGMIERADGSPWIGVLGPPALIAIGVLLTRTGRADARELVAFMENALETRLPARAA